MVTDGQQTSHMVISSIIYINVESLCCTPETNTILYLNYTLMHKSYNVLVSNIYNNNSTIEAREMELYWKNEIKQDGNSNPQEEIKYLKW